MTGIITDIQKFSLHDGPGIRSTVFFKGCNMHCSWCHNPETIREIPQQAYYKEKCIGCGHCDDCPTGARVTVGKLYSARDVFQEIFADAEFYRRSGGGLTLSGGEPLLQPQFAKEILKLCKEKGIPTAIETNLSLPYDRMEGLLPYLDMVFYDIKLFDEKAHRIHTGISNHQIFENAEKLDHTKLKTVIRTPLIPGITDDGANIKQIAEFARHLHNLEYYELLNYNVLAPSKYELIGEEYTLGKLERIPDGRVRELISLAEETGVRVVYNG